MTFISRKSRLNVSRWLDEFDAEYVLRAVRKRSDGRLKRFSSCDDLRAWTNNLCLNHDHLVELMSEGEFLERSRFRLYGRYIPVPVLLKLFHDTKDQAEGRRRKKSKSEVNVKHLSSEKLFEEHLVENDNLSENIKQSTTEIDKLSENVRKSTAESEKLSEIIRRSAIDSEKLAEKDENISKIQQEKFMLEKSLLECTSLLGRALEKLEKVNCAATYVEEDPKRHRSEERFHRTVTPRGRPSLNLIPKKNNSIKYSELLRKISGLREKLMQIQECQQQVKEKIQSSQQKMERCVSSDQVTELYNWQEQVREKALERKLEKLISARGKILSEMYQALTQLNILKRNSRNGFGATDVSSRGMESDLNEFQALKQSVSCFCGCQCSGLDSTDTEKIPGVDSSPSDRSYTVPCTNTKWDAGNYGYGSSTGYNRMRAVPQRNVESDIEESCRSTDVSSSSGLNYKYRSRPASEQTYSNQTTYYGFSKSNVSNNQTGTKIEDNEINERMARQRINTTPQREIYTGYDECESFEGSPRNGRNGASQRERNRNENYGEYERTGRKSPSQNEYQGSKNTRDYSRNNSVERNRKKVSPSRDSSEENEGNENFEGFARNGRNTTHKKRKDDVERTERSKMKSSGVRERKVSESVGRNERSSDSQKDSYEDAEDTIKDTSPSRNEGKIEQEAYCREIYMKNLQCNCSEDQNEQKEDQNLSAFPYPAQVDGSQFIDYVRNSRPKTSPTTKAERNEMSRYPNARSVAERRVKSETTMKEIEKTLRNYEQRLNRLNFVECKVECIKRKLLAANNLKKQLIKDKLNLQSKIAKSESNSREMLKLCMENKELKKKVQQLVTKFETQCRKVQNLKCTAQRARELECETQELKKTLSQYKNSFEHQRKCIRKWENVVAAQRTEIENLMNHVSQLMKAKELARTNRANEQKYVQRTRSHSPYLMRGQVITCNKPPTQTVKLQSDDEEHCWCEQYNWQQNNYSRNRVNCEEITYRRPPQWC